MKKLPLSLVVITLNEEKNIERCIRSVPWVSEVIVLDSFSSDKTVEIAQKLGARVEQLVFQGYRAQKQKATELATQPWVLSLDADECLSSSLSDEIHKIFTSEMNNSPSQAVAYQMPRLSYYLGRWIQHGGWYPDYQLRLFKKGAIEWTGGEVHERAQIHTVGKLVTLQNPLHHFVFRNLEHQIETNNRYSSQGALDLKVRGQKFHLLRLLLKPFGKFLECYIWKLGFLDRGPGFIIALSAAQSMFLKQAKLWEIEKFKETV